MKNLLDKVSETASYLRDKGFADANVGLVLGTGPKSFIDLIDVEKAMDFSNIPHFPAATVEFHKGRQSSKGFSRFHFFEIKINVEVFQYRDCACSI
jgi:hypothetical protein